jgi:hypothetical protein
MEQKMPTRSKKDVITLDENCIEIIARYKFSFVTRLSALSEKASEIQERASARTCGLHLKQTSGVSKAVAGSSNSGETIEVGPAKLQPLRQ